MRTTLLWLREEMRFVAGFVMNQECSRVTLCPDVNHLDEILPKGTHKCYGRAWNQIEK